MAKKKKVKAAEYHIETPIRIDSDEIRNQIQEHKGALRMQVLAEARKAKWEIGDKVRVVWETQQIGEFSRDAVVQAVRHHETLGIDVVQVRFVDNGTVIKVDAARVRARRKDLTNAVQGAEGGSGDSDVPGSGLQPA